MVEEKISRLSNKVVVHETNSVFKNEDVKADLIRLNKDFVVLPIDKASSNQVRLFAEI